MEKLVLIDGNSLINRAYYAMPLLSTKDGIYTNAVYGFMNMFMKMYSDIKPEYVAVAFDRPAPTFRHKMFDQYKGTRKPMPDELRPQIQLLKNVLKLMGVKIVEKDGIEADDIIGTIAKSTSIKTYIFTGDKDSFQLVDSETEVHFTRRGISDVEIYNNDNFKEKTGIEPWQVIELKALMGDASDNIPGVNGVGEKTAKNLIETYKDINTIYAHTEELTGKLKEKIIEGKESAYLSKMLATICVTAEIDTNIENMRFSLPLSKEVQNEFTRLEFKSLSNRQELYSDGVEIKTEAESTKNADKIYIDDLSKETELNGEKIAVIIGQESMNFSDGEKEYIISIKRTLIDDGFELTEGIKYVLSTIKGRKVIFYSKKDMMHLTDEVKEPFDFNDSEDLSILKYLVDFSGGAETLSEVLINYGMDIKTPAYSMLVVYNKLYSRLVDENMEKLYLEVELPLVDVLYSMESSGFKVDYNALEETGKKYSEILYNLDREIKELAGEMTLNVNSPKQLGEVLFEKLKVGKGKKTKTGYSTSAEVLESLEDAHPIIGKILSYRKIQKLQSTYIEGLKGLIDRNTGIVHTSFNQTVTSTGRLSSKEPNLQNIPARDEDGRLLRKFFVPRSSERILVGADYSQIELRLLASFSDCEQLIKAFNEGEDIHKKTASKVFKVPMEDVTKQMRIKAKAVNFGVIYGISEYGLAKQINTSAKEAKEYIDSYFNEFPAVKEYMNRNVDFARKNGYAVTLLNRRRYIKEINSPNFNLRSFGERASMNMPLQGSSADIIKLAMIGVYRKLKNNGLKSELILQVHDELIIDAYKNELEKVKEILVSEMENAVKLKVKLTVEVGEGETWFDAK